MSHERIAPALGKISSGLYIVSALHDGQRYGMLASFIEQAGFQPPLISMSLANGRTLSQILDNQPVFGINILGKHNHELVRPFVKPTGIDAFEGHSLVENPWQLPQMAEAMAFLACKMVNRMPAGDHTLYLAEVIDGALQHDHEQPMIRIRRNGFDY
jgi:flavin reductase (DIM6/NTAB) family NADH-FMN oxidoreductase RutF